MWSDEYTPAYKGAEGNRWSDEYATPIKVEEEEASGLGLVIIWKWSSEYTPPYKGVWDDYCYCYYHLIQLFLKFLLILLHFLEFFIEVFSTYEVEF